MLSLGYIAFQNRQKGLEKPYHKDYRKIFCIFFLFINQSCGTAFDGLNNRRSEAFVLQFVQSFYSGSTRSGYFLYFQQWMSVMIQNQFCRSFHAIRFAICMASLPGIPSSIPACITACIYFKEKLFRWRLMRKWYLVVSLAGTGIFLLLQISVLLIADILYRFRGKLSK